MEALRQVSNCSMRRHRHYYWCTVHPPPRGLGQSSFGLIQKDLRPTPDHLRNGASIGIAGHQTQRNGDSSSLSQSGSVCYIKGVDKTAPCKNGHSG